MIVANVTVKTRTIDLSVPLCDTVGCVSIEASLVFFKFSMEVLWDWTEISPRELDMDLVIELWVEYELKDEM